MHHTEYKIGVITNMNGPSMQDMQKVAKENGVIFETISTDHIPLTGFTSSSLVEKICQYDIIYYRTGMRDICLRHLGELLTEKNIPFVNFNISYVGLHNKIQQILHADTNNIPHPKSIYTKYFDHDIIAKYLGVPYVVKPNYGSKGNEVALISSADELAHYEETKTKTHQMFQEFIPDAVEYRVYTVGDKGVAAYKKTGGDGFRKNLHQGGSMEAVESDILEQLLHAGSWYANVFDAELSGVDILYKDSVFYFLELNLQPGWEGLERLSGVKYSEETLKYILQKAYRHYNQE